MDPRRGCAHSARHWSHRTKRGNHGNRIEMPDVRRCRQGLDGRGCGQSRLVAGAVEHQHPAPALAAVKSDGAGVRLRGRVPAAGPVGGDQGPARPDDRFAGLVAGRLRPLRPVFHPHGVAQRGHLPRGRRPRWRGLGFAALRAAQQLAGQRQPGQGTPAAVAGQAEVRPQHLLGRPDDPGRQRRPRIHGLQDLRLCRRARGRLGARGGHLLGPRGQVAGRRALQRRPRPGQPARGRADGSDLRQPGRSERQARTRWPRRATSARPSPAWR